MLDLNSTWRVTSRHNTTRYLTRAFGTQKSCDVLCRACFSARRNTLVTTSATSTTRTTRVQGRRHSVDWRGHVHVIFPDVVPETDANPEHKRLNLYTRALMLRRTPCWKITARHGRHDERGKHVLCRDVTQHMEFGLYCSFPVFYIALCAYRLYVAQTCIPRSVFT